MPPKGFVKPKLNGTVLLKRFESPQEEISFPIKKGELVDSIDDIASKFGLVNDEENPFFVVDEQQLMITSKLFDGNTYYVSGGNSQPGSTESTETQCPPDSTVAYVYHPDMLLHDPDGHRSPETSHRLRRGIEKLRQSPVASELLPPEMWSDSLVGEHKKGSAIRRGYFVPPRCATNEEIYAFHKKETYQEFLDKGTVLPDLKSDVYCNKDTSSRAVKLSVGGIIDASSIIFNNILSFGKSQGSLGETRDIFSSFCLIRPPGHHCTADRPSGFCLVNNVCLATDHLLRNFKVEGKEGRRTPRIAILDLDVHFGEGIAEYMEEKAVPGNENFPLLYLSVHRFDEATFYPFEATGASTFTGQKHKESICNMSINTHANDVSKCEAVISDHLLEELMDRVILPRLTQFGPDFLFVSMGFDAAYGDPLGKMAVEGGFCRSIARLKQWCASFHREGPPVGLLVALEGGYSPEAVAQGILHVSYALSYPIDSPLVLTASRPQVPKTWNDLRLKQERKYAQWEKSERLKEEEPQRLKEDDNTLLEKHMGWCKSEVDRILSAHT